MITLNQEEKKIREEQERIFRQVNAARGGYVGTISAINEKGKLITVPVIHHRGKKGHRF